MSSRVQLAFSGNKLNEHLSSDFIHIWRRNIQVDRKPITASRNGEDEHELSANVVPEQSGLPPINNNRNKIAKHANRNNVQSNIRWKCFTEVDMMRQAACSFRLLLELSSTVALGFARLYSVPELNLKDMTLRGPRKLLPVGWARFLSDGGHSDARMSCFPDRFCRSELVEVRTHHHTPGMFRCSHLASRSIIRTDR